MSESVKHDQPGRRFTVEIDGEAVGFTEYREHDGQRIFFHTEIDPDQGGKGLAGTLVKTALDQTVAEGQRIVAVCPYVAKTVERDDTWSAHVDPVTDAVKDFLRGELQR